MKAHIFYKMVGCFALITMLLQSQIFASRNRQNFNGCCSKQNPECFVCDREKDTADLIWRDLINEYVLLNLGSVSREDYNKQICFFAARLSCVYYGLPNQPNKINFSGQLRKFFESAANYVNADQFDQSSLLKNYINDLKFLTCSIIELAKRCQADAIRDQMQIFGRNLLGIANNLGNNPPDDEAAQVNIDAAANAINKVNELLVFST